MGWKIDLERLVAESTWDEDLVNYHGTSLVLVKAKHVKVPCEPDFRRWMQATGCVNSMPIRRLGKGRLLITGGEAGPGGCYLRITYQEIPFNPPGLKIYPEFDFARLF
jgi:hypothetical protein